VRRRAAAALGAFAALACAGCSFGPGAVSSAVTLRVTEDFGAHTVTQLALGSVPSRETDLQMLEHHARVRTKPGGPKSGGRLVESIDGDSGAAGRRAWSYYVNGVRLTKTAGNVGLVKGDHVWWDLHAGPADAVRAVVGSFPEPFLHGLFGRRYPSTIECSPGMKASCASITAEFTRFHIPLSPAGAGYGSGTDSLSINVGTWDQLSTEVVAGLIAKGPGASGEDAAGHVIRTLGPGAGLIAATAGPSDVPTWVVAGTDRAGVAAAAHALTVSALAGRFALAVQGEHHYPVPLPGAS
jgi:hypothetical protein